MRQRFVFGLAVWAPAPVHVAKAVARAESAVAIKVSMLLALVLCTSCSRLPARIAMPAVDPVSAGTRALEQYDTDEDGLLDAEELSASPPLLAALSQIDTNSDGKIASGEISDRIESWIERKQAIHVLPCQVYWRGRELTDADVRFIPEPFLGEAFRPASGTTDHYGTANIVHAAEDRPDPDFPQGVRVGFYRIEVSKIVDGKEVLPARFNTESKLGQEIAADAAGLGLGMLTFRLR